MQNSAFSRDFGTIKNLLVDKNIGIVIGETQTVDIVAAALSLYLSLSATGKTIQVVSIQEPIVEFSSLVGINKIKKSFKGDTKQLVVSLPYRKGEVGKVSFKEENGRINFYLTATEGQSITPFESGDINLTSEGGNPSVVLAIGVVDEQELEESIGDLKKTKVINIDSNPLNSRYGDVAIVDEKFSSVSEIIVSLLKQLSIPIDPDAAQNLLDGLLDATKDFSTTTSPFAFEAAGELLRLGARRRSHKAASREDAPTEDEPRDIHTNRSSSTLSSQKISMENISQPHRVSFTKNPLRESIQKKALDISERHEEAVIEKQRAPKGRDEYQHSDSSRFARNSSQKTGSDNDKNSKEKNLSQNGNGSVPRDWLSPKVFKGSRNQD